MQTKEEQLYWNKPQKNRNAPKKQKIKKDDKEYLNWLNERRGVLKCFICGKTNNIEFHHIKDYSMQKKNHKEVLPLCGISCHRLGKFSAHGNAKWFKSKYPIEIQRNYAKKLYDRYKLSLI